LKKKILFITPNSFTDNNGGLFLFNTLFSYFKECGFYWYTCSNNSKKSLLNYNFDKTFYVNERFLNNNILNVLARRYFFLGIPWFFIKYKIFKNFISFKVVKVINECEIEKLWIYTSQITIPVTKKVVVDTGIKYHLSIQDDIHTHLPNFEVFWLKDDFKFLIENADSIDFISNDMECYYRSKFRIKAKSTVFLVGRFEEIEKPIISKKIKIIGYSGNIWCADTFIPFLKSIKILNSIRNDSIKVKIFTFHFPYSFLYEYLDIIDFQTIDSYPDLLIELQKCDLLYLPMTFDSNKQVTNITSFPSKILTYLNAGVPILNHSPENASTHNFIISNKVGVSVVDLKVESFVKILSNENVLGFENRIAYSSFSDKALNIFNHDDMVQGFINILYN